MLCIVAKPVGNFWFLLFGVLTRGDIKEVNRVSVLCFQDCDSILKGQNSK